MTFVLDNGEENVVKTQDYASSLTAPSDILKTGFTFKGWDADVPATVPSSDQTFTAQWDRNSYKVVYKVDGELYHTDTIAYASAITALSAPSKEGYTFSGWSEIPATVPANDVEVSGSFTVNKYLLTVLVDGNVLYFDSIAYGTRLADYADIITKNGIDLSQWEWYGQIEIITMPAHDVTINAVLDAVRPVMMGADESVIYDLTGKRIETDDITTLPAGIYIWGGRKFIIQ